MSENKECVVVWFLKCWHFEINLQFHAICIGITLYPRTWLYVMSDNKKQFYISPQLSSCKLFSNFGWNLTEISSFVCLLCLPSWCNCAYIIFGYRNSGQDDLIITMHRVSKVWADVGLQKVFSSDWVPLVLIFRNYEKCLSLLHCFFHH